MDFPALVGSASIVVDSGTKKAGCRPGRNVYRAIYTIMAKITSAHTYDSFILGLDSTFSLKWYQAHQGKLEQILLIDIVGARCV